MEVHYSIFSGAFSSSISLWFSWTLWTLWPLFSSPQNFRCAAALPYLLHWLRATKLLVRWADFLSKSRLASLPHHAYVYFTFPVVIGFLQTYWHSLEVSENFSLYTYIDVQLLPNFVTSEIFKEPRARLRLFCNWVQSMPSYSFLAWFKASKDHQGKDFPMKNFHLPIGRKVCQIRHHFFQIILFWKVIKFKHFQIIAVFIDFPDIFR